MAASIALASVATIGCAEVSGYAALRVCDDCVDGGARPTDAIVTDTSIDDIAIADAASDTIAEAAIGTRCERESHTRCVDFESDDTFPFRLNPYMGGVIEIRSGLASSGERAAVMITGDGKMNADVEEVGQRKFTRHVLSYDLHFEKAPVFRPGDVNLQLGALRFATSTAEVEARILLQPGGAYLQTRGADAGSAGDLVRLPVGRWIRVMIEIDPSGGRIRATLGGVVLHDGATTFAIPIDAATMVIANAGLSAINPGPPTTARLDDVALDY